MPNNCLLDYIAGAGGPTRDGATALGGTLDTTFAPANNTFSNNNRTVAIAGAKTARSVNSFSSGKVYFEIHIDTWNAAYGPQIGISKNTTFDSTSYSVWTAGSNIASSFYSGTQSIPYGPQWAIGDTMGVLIDMVGLTITFYRNGVSLGVAATIQPGTYYAMATSAGSNYPCTLTTNFGDHAFM